MERFLTDPFWNEKLIVHLKQHSAIGREQQYRSAYIIAGVEAIERVWTERGFTESIDEVVEIIQRAHDRQVPLD